MSIILNILVSAVAVLVTGRLLSGVSIDGFGTAVVVAIVPGFRVARFWWALGFAFVLALVNSAFHAVARV